jgi:16S rRNA (uracil1498-N3)-methyltransferase
MALRRFFMEGPSPCSETFVIHGDLFHHIRDVCRFTQGSQFEILPGDGSAQLVEIIQMTNRELGVRRISQRQLSPLPKPYLTLALSLPKLPKVDWIVEKCVELGVFEIRTFVSDYSFLRKTAELSANRLQRWEKLIQAATQQSGRGDLMQIRAPVPLKELLSDFNLSRATGGLFPYEGEARQGLSQALQELKNKNLDHIWVFVGSEGGFSTPEVEMFKTIGLNPLSLGDQILRVETACLALVSIIKYEIGTLR